VEKGEKIRSSPVFAARPWITLYIPDESASHGYYVIRPRRFKTGDASGLKNTVTLGDGSFRVAAAGCF
jgi:hypothetical protein